jgi:hypothetical protein
MIDWKIAAGAVVVIAAFSLLAGGLGMGSFFSGITGQIGQWLQNSPFSGFFSPPTAGSKAIDITLYPSNLTLKFSRMNLTILSTSVQDFKGTLDIRFQDKNVVLKPENSEMKITTDLRPFVINNLQLNDLLLENMRFETENIKEQNGTVEIFGFNGSAYISPDNIVFSGNATNLKIKMGDKTWEMK